MQALEAKELELIGQKEAALASERRRKDQALSSARRRLEEEKVQRLQSYRQKAEAEPRRGDVYSQGHFTDMFQGRRR